MAYNDKIKAVELNRNNDNINKIYLHKENGGWFSAYEWSAYLCEFFQNGLKDEQRLNPIKKLGDDKTSNYIKIGLKRESMDKYFPNADIKTDENGNIIIEVNMDNYAEFIMGTPYIDLLNGWKDKVEIKETKSKQKANKGETIYNKPVKFMTIMGDIIKYDINDKSLDDLKKFINKLKEDCVSLIC